MVTRRISTLKRPKHALRSAGKATTVSKVPRSYLPTVIPDAWSRSSATPPSASLRSVRKFQICLASFNRHVHDVARADSAAGCQGAFIGAIFNPKQKIENTEKS